MKCEYCGSVFVSNPQHLGKCNECGAPCSQDQETQFHDMPYGWMPDQVCLSTQPSERLLWQEYFLLEEDK